MCYFYMTTVYLGIGSNIGDRKENLCQAILMLSAKVGSVVAISSLYESESWGYNSEHKFLNAVVAIETELYPEELLSDIKEIETVLGRTQKQINNYEDRPIDIDILFYDLLVYETDNLIIPHPHIEKRKFVLVPMAEIAPDFIHPIIGKKIKELNRMCKDSIQLFLK